jgi:hypothetical protein
MEVLGVAFWVLERAVGDVTFSVIADSNVLKIIEKAERKRRATRPMASCPSRPLSCLQR